MKVFGQFFLRIRLSSIIFFVVKAEAAKSALTLGEALSKLTKENDADKIVRKMSQMHYTSIEVSEIFSIRRTRVY